MVEIPKPKFLIGDLVIFPSGEYFGATNYAQGIIREATYRQKEKRWSYSGGGIFIPEEVLLKFNPPRGIEYVVML